MVDLYLQGKECVLSIVVFKVRVIEISACDYRGLESLNGALGLNVYLRNIRRIGEYWKYGTKSFIFFDRATLSSDEQIPAELVLPYIILYKFVHSMTCVCVLRVGKTKQ